MNKTKILKIDRETMNGHLGFTVWFTGLSASGKSTLANALEVILNKRGCRTYTLDGDIIRKGLNKDLGFSVEDRGENVRRIAEVARILNQAGVISLVAFISPYEEDRILASEIIGKNFNEIFVDCPVEVCERRDPKGLYKRARKGEILNFTGISDPYENPILPDLHVRTNKFTIDQCVDMIVQYLENEQLIKS